MSIRLMGQIFDMDIRPQGKKLVLLAFADAADSETGMTWIALESQRGSRSICTKASASLRSVTRHVAELEADGHLERYETPGRGNLWRVHATPVRCEMEGGQIGYPHGAMVDSLSKQADKLSTEPSSNHHLLERDASETVSLEGAKCPISGRPLPAGLTLEQWEAFLDMRAAIAKPVRTYVAAALLQRCDEIGRAGWHVGDVVDRSTINAWGDVLEPEHGRVTGVRRVVAGKVAEPAGMSDADTAEYRRICEIEDMPEKLAQLRAWRAAVERKNAPEALGAMVGELPLRLLPGTMNAIACRRKPKS